MNCKNCGNEIKNGSKFCSKCGSEIKHQKQTKKMVIVSLIICALLCFLGGGSFMLWNSGVFLNNDYQYEITDFSVNESYLIANQDNELVFTVKLNTKSNELKLYLEQDELASMSDDGLDSDAIANDGIYTAKITNNVDEAGCFEYYVQVGDTVSEALRIYSYRTPVEEDFDTMQEVDQGMEEIETGYLDDTGFVPTESVDAVIDEMVVYAEELLANEIILFYEESDDGVAIKYVTGLTCVYIPTVEGVLNSGAADTSVSIVTLEPCEDVMEMTNGSTDSIAQNIEEVFDDYTFSNNCDSSEVTLDIVKSFTSNQLILWNGHGTYLEATGPGLITGEDFDWNKWLWDLQYWGDCVLDLTLKSSEGKLIITSKYIDKYCGDMSNTFVYLGTCSSGKTNVLGESFINKGVAVVIGYSDVVCVGYHINISEETMSYLTKINQESQNYYTVSESLSLAKEKWGEDEGVWYFNEKGEVESTPAEIVVFGGSDAENYRLMEGKIENDVEEVNVEIDYESFINNKEYEQYFPEYDYRYQEYVDYCIIDINSDNIDELIVRINEGAYYYNLIFGYDTSLQEIALVENVYSYSDIRYSTSESTIRYFEWNPNGNMGAFGIYKIDDMKLELVTVVGYDSFDTSGNLVDKYYFKYIDQEQIIISETEHAEYTSKFTELSWINLPTDSVADNTSSKEDASDYIGQNLYVALEGFSDMVDVGSTDGIEYKNDYLIISANYDEVIEFVSIQEQCEYCMYGIEIGDSSEEAVEYLQGNGWYTDSWSNTSIRVKNNETSESIVIYIENDFITSISLWQ